MDNPDIVFIDLDHTLTDTDCVPAWKNMLAGMRLVSDSQRALLRNWLGANASEKMPKIYALGGGA
jgi:phosphoserine phosphatase